MERISSGYELFHALLREGVEEWKLPMSDFLMHFSVKDQLGRASVRMIDGSFLSIEVNIVTSTPTATNETGGPSSA